jgi:hypothetical protein
MSDLTTFDMDKEITIIKKIVKATYRVAEYNAFSNAKIAVTLFAVNNLLIDQKLLVIDGTDFLNWGTDDSYLTNWIKNKIDSIYL